MLLASLNQKSVALEKEKSALMSLNEKKQQEVEEQTQQFKLTKSEILKLKEKACQLEIDVSKGKEKNRELEDQIVNSPQKYIQITNDLENALEEAKVEVPNKKQQNLAIIKKLDCYKTVFTSLKASTDDIKSTCRVCVSCCFIC